MINNSGLFSKPSLITFTKGANNSDHNCKCRFNVHLQLVLHESFCCKIFTHFYEVNFDIVSNSSR